MTNLNYKTVVVDIETTGLNTVFDEILQLAIMGDDGTVIYNEYFRPIQKTEWEEAEAVNHISYSMVKDKNTIQHDIETIQEILSSADVIIGYSTDFVIKFLRYAGIKFSSEQTVINLMDTFAEIYGEYDDYFNDYRWQTLKCCAKYFGYDTDELNLHESVSDCKVILHSYNQIKKEYEVNLKSYSLA